MANGAKTLDAGEDLVKQELVTREELEAARAQEARTGTPWYKQLLQRGVVSFGTIESVLKYEFHPKSQRQQQQTLGDTLVAMGALTPAQLAGVLEEQNRTGRLLGSILQERKLVTPDALAQALAQQYNMPYAAYASTKSDLKALEAVPENLARRHEMIPVSLEGDRLTVLIVSPQVRKRLDEAGMLLGLRIHPLLTAVPSVPKAIVDRYAALRGQEEVITLEPVREPAKKVRLDEVSPLETAKPAARAGKESAAAKPKAKTSSKTSKQGKSAAVSVPQEEAPVSRVETTAAPEADTRRFEEIARMAQGSSVIKMVSTIIEGAVNSGATDVHLDPQDPEMRVRYRIDGILHDVMSIPQNIEAAVISRIKIMADLDITDTRHPHDGHISLEVGDQEFDVRVATLPTYLGERVVLRLLDQSSVLSGIRDLGLEDDDEKTLERLIGQPYGMILVTGPTGSGKTTTLYAALNQKNVMTDSIVTLEDPVEYQLSGINQVQIDADLGNTFASTLRAALRQDIDVLLVGEIRDAETARIAVRAAMTGHLVFSTLHTNDAPEAIDTLRNMDVPHYLLASALTAVVGQRLVRTICGNCRKGFKPTAALLKSINLPATTKQLYRGAGCDLCYNTGNRGRTGIFEILEVTPEIRKLIAEQAPMEALVKAAKLKTMAMRCREKLKKGIVEPEEFLRVIRT